MRTVAARTATNTLRTARGSWSSSPPLRKENALSWVGIAAALLLYSAVALSQPDIRITRIDVTWPQISVWFSVDCDGIPNFELSKFDISLRENGTPIGNFTLDCGDSIPPCPLSAALVFDASGSMAGIGIFDAKEAGKAFLEAMDETRDEACVIAFGSFVRTIQPLTSSRFLLNAAIDSIEAMGATALIDGTYRGVEELALRATRPCKAVIVLSDGVDNMSMRTLKEVIDLAAGIGIRIYTVGLGVRIDTAMLRDIATGTGGRFFLCSSSRQLVDVYRAIAKLVTRDTADCVIRYDGRCTDGAERVVELTIRDFCGGTDSDSMRCTTPGNAGKFIPLGLTMNGASVSESQHARIVVGIRDTVTDLFFPPLELVVHYDPALLGAPVLTGEGSILSPFNGYIAGGYAGGLRIRLGESHIAVSPGPLFTLDFAPADVRDTVCTRMALTRAMFDNGCLTPSLDSARVCVLPCFLDPPLSPHGVVDICAGDTIVFHTVAGCARYAWYRDGRLLPDSLSYYRASVPGTYSAVVTDSLGCAASTPAAILRALERLSGVIGNPDTLYGKAGSFLDIPVFIHPRIRAGRRVDATVSLRWDPHAFDLIDFRPAPKNVWEGDTHAVFSPGASEITLQGTAAGDLDHLVTARFHVADSPPSFIDAMSFHAVVSTGCDGVWETLSPHISVDGFCEPLLKKRPVVSVSNAPNPFAGETVITVVSNGWTSVDIADIFGRPVARLFEGEFGESERTFRYTHRNGGSGVYFVIVRTPSCTLSREIVSTR